MTKMYDIQELMKKTSFEVMNLIHAHVDEHRRQVRDEEAVGRAKIILDRDQALEAARGLKAEITRLKRAPQGAQRAEDLQHTINRLEQEIRQRKDENAKLAKQKSDAFRQVADLKTQLAACTAQLQALQNAQFSVASLPMAMRVGAKVRVVRVPGGYWDSDWGRVGDTGVVTEIDYDGEVFVKIDGQSDGDGPWSHDPEYLEVIG